MAGTHPTPGLAKLSEGGWDHRAAPHDTDCETPGREEPGPPPPVEEEGGEIRKQDTDSTHRSNHCCRQRPHGNHERNASSNENQISLHLTASKEMRTSVLELQEAESGQL